VPKLAVLTGAGISAESGIRTFRDSGGLWEGYDVMKVASPEGWASDPALVLDFYNKRRADVLNAEPNKGHIVLTQLEEHFETTIITQNVDDLHERAGSSNVLHLHGSLLESKSTLDDNLIYTIKEDLKIGDVCSLGSQLRPNIVWFGEMVPLLDSAIQMVENIDYFIVVGTSLSVYPAASLIEFVPNKSPKFIIDPNLEDDGSFPGVVYISEVASVGMEIVQEYLFGSLSD
jgi:NAD-dependent deacetylase